MYFFHSGTKIIIPEAAMSRRFFRLKPPAKDNSDQLSHSHIKASNENPGIFTAFMNNAKLVIFSETANLFTFKSVFQPPIVLLEGRKMISPLIFSLFICEKRDKSVILMKAY